MTRPLAGAEAVSAAADLAAGMSEAEQLALLPVSVKSDAFGHADALRAGVERRRRGRPAGAQNLATREMLKFVRQVLGDPLLERARDAMHTPETLAAELGCTKLEAFDRLDKIRADLARFYYAPLAPVDDQGKAVAPFFAMYAPGAQVAVDASGEARKPWEGEWSGYSAPITETQQNQALPASARDVSDGGLSDETGKGLK